MSYLFFPIFIFIVEFVPCVGANRRRMNILSDIERPDDQLCTIVQFDWEQLFGHNSDNIDDYKKQKAHDSKVSITNNVEGNEL